MDKIVVDEQEKISFCKKVFKALVSNQVEKLERGFYLRGQMRAAIDRGESPTGYRADWLRETAIKLVGQLEKYAGDFNERFTDDRASVHDLCDLLATATNMLKKTSK